MGIDVTNNVLKMSNTTYIQTSFKYQNLLACLRRPINREHLNILLLKEMRKDAFPFVEAEESAKMSVRILRRQEKNNLVTIMQKFNTCYY